MVLRLDPRLIPLWVTPTSVRFGIDRPLVTLEGVTAGHEVLLHALRVGATRPMLAALASEASLPPDSVEVLLGTLEPLLLDESGRRPLRVALERTSPWPSRDARLVESVASAVVASGADLVERGDAPDLAVIVSAHVVPPHVAAYWLSRDIPALPVTLWERSVVLGPLVVPGATACLHCVALHRSDEDPAWPALAAQLLDARTTDRMAADPVLVLSASARLAEALRELASGRASTVDETRMGGDGVVTARTPLMHPRCSCGAASAEDNGWERARTPGSARPSSASGTAIPA